MKKQKLAFIIGITGQDGCYLSLYLLKKNYKIIGFTRCLSNKNLKNIIKTKLKNKVTLKKYSDDNQKIIFNDPKNIHPKFMTFAFNVIEGREQDLAAASHPKDHTIRPQIVSIDSNPDYHSILSKYLNITGHGVILNTSFNENEPIVMSPNNAIDCFLRTSMDVLILDKFMISRKI